MIRPTLLAVPVLLTALALPACSGAGTPASSGPASRTAPRTSSPASGAQSSGLPLSLNGSLLTVADASGYRATAVTQVGTQPLPCTPHAPGLASQFPPQSRAALRFQAQRSAFQETLLGYANATTVDDVYAAAQDGYNCAAGQVTGIDAGINRVREVSGDGYRGERWDYRLANGTLGTSVIGQAGRVFLSIDFVAAAGGSGDVNPDVVLRAALERVRSTAPN